MTFPITEHTVKTDRHTTGYLACGPDAGPLLVFVHGWPELSRSWRHQLPAFASLGFRAVAPDMRGYGRSSTYTRQEDFALEQIVQDMLELLGSLGREKAVWIGHDWGSPVVWSMASHHPDKTIGVANLCVPYIKGFTLDERLPLIDRKLYPEAEYPVGQWDYQLFYRESFDVACAAFERDVGATVRALFRAGDPAGKGKPARTSYVRVNGGWFRQGAAPSLPRDAAILSEEDEHRYVAALERNGFFGPDSWYMNGPANIAYAERARANWRLKAPVLFIHAAYDYVCETLDSKLAEPMRANCADLTEATAPSGHWMAQERPAMVNAVLAKWLASKLPQLWTST